MEGNNKETLQDDIKYAVQSECNIRENVRNITIKVLSEGRLDTHEIRDIVGVVVKGAGLGAEPQGNEAQGALQSALSGLDDALSCAAEASKLAVQESAGHLRDFAEQDLKTAKDDLMSLEAIYLDALKQSTKDSSKLIAGILNDLLLHARNSGTSVGRQTKQIIKKLNQELGQTLTETVSAGSDSALKVASQLSFAAAGFLDGIAQTLDSKTKTKK